jgi:hypothetical protein
MKYSGKSVIGISEVIKSTTGQLGVGWYSMNSMDMHANLICRYIHLIYEFGVFII